jgi:hypothetical protein
MHNRFNANEQQLSFNILLQSHTDDNMEIVRCCAFRRDLALAFARLALAAVKMGQLVFSTGYLIRKIYLAPHAQVEPPQVLQARLTGTWVVCKWVFQC